MPSNNAALFNNAVCWSPLDNDINAGWPCVDKTDDGDDTDWGLDGLVGSIDVVVVDVIDVDVGSATDVDVVGVSVGVVAIAVQCSIIIHISRTIAKIRPKLPAKQRSLTLSIIW
jgi:hypothetical protein